MKNLYRLVEKFCLIVTLGLSLNMTFYNITVVKVFKICFFTNAFLPVIRIFIFRNSHIDKRVIQQIKP